MTSRRVRKRNNARIHSMRWNTQRTRGIFASALRANFLWCTASWVDPVERESNVRRSFAFVYGVYVFRTVTAKARILAPVRLLVARIFVRCISHFRHSIPIRSRIRFVLITQRDFISIPTIFLFFFFFLLFASFSLTFSRIVEKLLSLRWMYIRGLKDYSLFFMCFEMLKIC